jgi:hypothetical protein
LTEEIWKDIRGFEGYYQISNHGRVRSLDRIIPTKKFNIKRKGEVMSTSLNTKGYPHIRLCKNGKRETFRVHRLVAQTFLPNPNNDEIVNHKDSNKTNNNLDNLEWCSEMDNRQHARKIFNDTAYGEACNLSKLTEQQVREIRANGKNGRTNEQIAKLYNVSHETIRNVLNGNSWKHIL